MKNTPMPHLKDLIELLTDFTTGAISDRAFCMRYLYVSRRTDLKTVAKDVLAEINAVYLLCSLYEPIVAFRTEMDCEEGDLLDAAVGLLGKLGEVS